MFRNNPTIVLLALLLITAAFPLVKSTADEVKEPDSGVHVLVPESLTSIFSESELSGAKRREISGQSTTEKKISVVGIADGQPEMEIVNNGRCGVKPVFHGKYFHAQVMLSFGENMISVRWRKEGKEWNVENISLFRSSKLMGGPRVDYPPYAFHTPKNEEQCQECHQMQLTREEMETATDKSCLKCHENLSNNVYVHGPVNVGICTVCHDPNSKPNKYRIEEDDKTLCYSCHDDRKKIDEKMKLEHGPVGAGMCTVCHDPHGSPFKYQLVKSKNEICLMCHQNDANRWLGYSSLHPPFKKGECYRCHDPHSANYKYNLKANKKVICLLCHTLPIPGHLHEPGKTPLFKLPPDFPLTKQGKTMCLTCHDPHGAIGNHLTRRKGCAGCHPDKDS
ncbi:MAG: cytochrome c3 family protein [Nitrospirota bacterium]